MSRYMLLFVVLATLVCSVYCEEYTYARYTWTGPRASVLNEIKTKFSPAQITTYAEHSCSIKGEKNCPFDSADITAGGTKFGVDNRHATAPNALTTFLTENMQRLGIEYIIFAQKIYTRQAKSWRPMASRGSITANHWDHVHITFRADFGANMGKIGSAVRPANRPSTNSKISPSVPLPKGGIRTPDGCTQLGGTCATSCPRDQGTFVANLCPGNKANKCCIPKKSGTTTMPVPTSAPTPAPVETPATPSVVASTTAAAEPEPTTPNTAEASTTTAPAESTPVVDTPAATPTTAPADTPVSPSSSTTGVASSDPVNAPAEETVAPAPPTEVQKPDTPSTISFRRYTWTGQRAKTLLEIKHKFGPAQITTFPGHSCSRTKDGHRCPLDSADIFSGNTRYGVDNRRAATPNALAKFLTENMERLGIEYVIFAQKIYSRQIKRWRLMPNRGSITANHWDHVHITFRYEVQGGIVEAADYQCRAKKGTCQTTCSNGKFVAGLCPAGRSNKCCIPHRSSEVEVDQAELDSIPSSIPSHHVSSMSPHKGIPFNMDVSVSVQL